jgi:hypothetical protein
MTCANRLVLGVGVVGALALLGLLLRVVPGSPLAQDLGDLPRLASELAGEAERERELEALEKDIKLRARSRLWVAEELIAGRLSLLEAAAALRDVYRRSPSFVPEAYYRDLRDRSREERYCRDLIAAVGLQLWDHPGQAEEVTRRLEAELEEHLRRGPLRLPW